MIVLFNRRTNRAFIYTATEQFIEHRENIRNLSDIEEMLDEYQPRSYTFGTFTGENKWTAYSRNEKYTSDEKLINKLKDKAIHEPVNGNKWVKG